MSDYELRALDRAERRVLRHELERRRRALADMTLAIVAFGVMYAAMWVVAWAMAQGWL